MKATPADEPAPPAGSAVRLYLSETAAKEIRFPDDGAVYVAWFVFGFDRTGTYTHYRIQFRNDNQIVRFGGFALLG